MRLDELQERAGKMLPAPVSEYFSQGASACVTTSSAPEAWGRLRFRPRMLRDVSSVSTATEVLGHKLATPIMVAPTTLQRAAHPDGEIATARGAAKAGSLMVVSSNAGSAFEDIAATGVCWWLQPYVLRDRGLTSEMIKRGVDAGASAIVLTVDTPVVGRKHNAGEPVWDAVPAEFQRTNLNPNGLPEGALDKADDLTPDSIGWLREMTGLPVVVKGILRADDARTAVAAGAAAVYVSNHGGRQLDQAVATADALPAIAEAVAGTGAEVYVDGGLRRGEHIFGAMALGAKAVLLGRPVLWALTAGGESGSGGADGVAELITELTSELTHVMTLAGVHNADELTSDLVW